MSEPLSEEEEAGIRSMWWEQRPNRGALAHGYVHRLLATLDQARERIAVLEDEASYLADKVEAGGEA